MSEAYTFYAGAGKAQIRFTEEMFPTFGENYTGVHDPLTVQVLILKDIESYVLAACDVVILQERQEVVSMISERTGIPAEHVILHTSHVLAAPHFQKRLSTAGMRERGGEGCPEEELEAYAARDNLMFAAFTEALGAACGEALGTLQPARYGSGTCEAAVNINRVIERGDEWIQGTNQDGASDHTVTVLRFESLSGAPIAVLFHCNMAPGALEGSVSGDERLVSADVAGAAERYIERFIGQGVKAFYLTGTTGDQWQALRARIDYIDETGEQVIRDMGDAGFVMPQILGLRLAQQVVKTAQSISCSVPQTPLKLVRRDFAYPGKEGVISQCPAAVLSIGGDAWTAIGVEVTVAFGQKVKMCSPFNHTLLIEFATDGGGYMAEREYYTHHGYQAGKSRFGAGAAEAFCEDLCAFLKAVK